jgi:hypothetical protein
MLRGLSVGVDKRVHQKGRRFALSRQNQRDLSRARARLRPRPAGDSAIYLGHNTQGQNQNSRVAPSCISASPTPFSAIYIVVGRGNQTNNLMAFNPGFLSLNPVAYFRSIDTTNRVGVWAIGDNSASGSTNAPSSGPNDFTGGRVDALINMMFVGRGAQNNHGTATGAGIGTLTFNNGSSTWIRCSSGYQNIRPRITRAAASARVNVNTTNATLIVDALEFRPCPTNTSIVHALRHVERRRREGHRPIRSLPVAVLEPSP